MSVDNPGGKRKWRGGYACECVELIVPVIEQRMIAAGTLKANLDVYQYCYNAGGVAASAGTHDAGGVLDIAQDDWDELTILRECGAAAWARTPAEGFDPHTHMVLCGCPHLSAGAADQVQDYRNGRNGLANNGPDTGPDVPYITWQDAYAKYATGVFGMTLRKFSRSTDQKFTGNGAWQVVRVDDDGDMTLVYGPTDAYLAITHVTVNGLDPGQACQFRYQAVDDYPDDRPTKIIQSYPITELVGTTGAAYGPIVYANDLTAGDGDAKRKLRLYVNPPDAVNVTLSTVSARVFQQ